MARVLVLKGTDGSRLRNAPVDYRRDDSNPNKPLLLKPDPKNVKKMWANVQLIEWLLLGMAEYEFLQYMDGASPRFDDSFSRLAPTPLKITLLFEH
ncbi:MAG: hypothetical protein HN882_12790 [Planctomycetaceae bacterium]|jgi:hypothetical protein|nr:hypothetical protein [Planctomycetaceae bacterium]